MKTQLFFQLICQLLSCSLIRLQAPAACGQTATSPPPPAINPKSRRLLRNTKQALGALALLVGLAQPAQAEPFAYITNQGSNSVSVIDTASNSVSATVAVGSAPVGVAVTPDGNRVYVTNYVGSSVSVIDTASNSVSATVTVGINPYGVAVTPDGSKVYVTNFYSSSVSIIDTASNSVSATVTVGAYPTGVAVTPDGSKVYVANQGSNSVSVIDTASNSVSATVPVGSFTIGFGQFIKPAPTDTTAPTCTASATPNTLWSPNHKLVNIITTVNVSDSGSGPNGFKLLSVSSSEADAGLGSDDVAGDIQGWIMNTPDTAGQLRNERYAKAGRTYTFTYQARDRAGNTGNCSTTVKVPNNQRK